MSAVGGGGAGGVGRVTDRLLRLLLRLYPEDFRDEMGDQWLASYRRRASEATSGGGRPGAAFWLRAVADSVRNGLGERLNPAVVWRRRGNWGRDTQRAVRRLVRAPVFTLATVGTLAIGLGAFAVVWSAVDNVLLEPPPYDHPEDLYFVWRDYTEVFDLARGYLSGPDIVALDTAGGPVEAVVGVDVNRFAAELTPTGRPEEVRVMQSGADLFDMLGVRAAIGRTFAPDEVGPGQASVAVLGHELWRTRLGGDSAVVGREIRLNGAPYTVIGVMPKGFQFVQHSSPAGPPNAADLYVPFDIDLADQNPGGGSFGGLLRARPGAEPEGVAAAVATVGERLDEQYHGGAGIRYYPVQLVEDLVAPIRPALVVLGLAGAFLVLVLMVNLATLLLGRAAGRERELAVSRALGADGWALARAALLEGVMLGVLGAAVGLLLALRGTRALVEMAPPDLPRQAEIAVDPRVVAVVLAAGILVGLVAALLPAIWAARTRLGAVLRDAAVRGGGGGGRLRRGMVVVQVALSLVLLTAGGGLVRSFDRLLRTDPGFDATGALTFRIQVTGDAYSDAASLTQLHDRLLAGLRAIPGVTAAGAVSALPLEAEADQTQAEFPGAPGNTGAPENDIPLIEVFGATEGIFSALGARVIDGQPFVPAGVQEQAVIDHTLAQQFFPGGSAVGATLVFGGSDTLRVVGVVQQPRLYDVHRDDRGQVWRLSREYTYASLNYVVRSSRPPLSLLGDVRAAVAEVDRTLPVADARPIDSLVETALGRQRLSAGLIGTFAMGALLLAAMGLFGIVSSAVTRRRTELGIRMALGADAPRVLRMVLGDGLALVGLGLLIAVPGIWASGRLLDSVLVEVSPFDGVTLIAVALVLGAVATLACWIPARRVTSIDPAGALRAD